MMSNIHCPFKAVPEKRRHGAGLILGMAILFFFMSPTTLFASETRLVVPDILCLPGDNILVEAYLFRVGIMGLFRPQIQGELLRFSDANGKLIRERLTDPSGMARIRYKAGKPGHMSFTVQLSDNPRYSAEPCTGTVFVRSGKHPLFFVLVEGGLIEQEPSPALWKDPTKSKPFPGSVEKTRKIKTHSTLVYLTPLPMAQSGKMRVWLKNNEYPLAPLLFLNQPISEELHKGEVKDTARLESLWTDRARPACLATGNRLFAESAAEKGFTTYLLDPEKEPGPGPGEESPQNHEIILVQGWEEIPSSCRSVETVDSGG